MKEKIIRFFRGKKQEADKAVIKAKVELDSAASVLKDTSGGNHTTEILVGMAVSVLVGLLIYNAATGYFTNTLFPKVTGKIGSIFS
ncbi:MAG TPA: hypothetical protein VHP31_09190 [Caproicibacter sp.]|nr:hypothetical protein [Caproicibacter sp.]